MDLGKLRIFHRFCFDDVDFLGRLLHTVFFSTNLVIVVHFLKRPVAKGRFVVCTVRCTKKSWFTDA